LNIASRYIANGPGRGKERSSEIFAKSDIEVMYLSAFLQRKVVYYV